MNHPLKWRCSSAENRTTCKHALPFIITFYVCMKENLFGIVFTSCSNKFSTMVSKVRKSFFILSQQSDGKANSEWSKKQKKNWRKYKNLHKQFFQSQSQALCLVFIWCMLFIHNIAFSFPYEVVFFSCEIALIFGFKMLAKYFLKCQNMLWDSPLNSKLIAWTLHNFNDDVLESNSICKQFTFIGREIEYWVQTINVKVINHNPF